MDRAEKPTVANISQRRRQVMSVHRITKLKDIAQCLAHTRNLINVSLAFFLYPWSLQRPVNIQLAILGHAITKQFR